MSLIVKKFGGTSVATPEKILKVAAHLKTLRDEGNQLLVVVSAMGQFTDELVALSQQITTTPSQREFDMLLSAGERISISLLSMALHKLGCDAISFTGSQSGVLTDSSHNNARIKDIKPFRVQEELEKGKIVIVAGFQGVDPVTKEITTLGRGGSDTTAVALACAFKAVRCDILTDVAGVFSGNPRLVQNPKPLPEIDYESMLEMAYWGASVLHYRCVELAERSKIPLSVNLSDESARGTIIQSIKKEINRSKEGQNMEQVEILSVNSQSQILEITFVGEKNVVDSLETLRKKLEAARLPLPQVLHQQANAKGVQFLISAPEETFPSIKNALDPKHCQFDDQLMSVTITGRGLTPNAFIFDLVRFLAEQKLTAHSVVTTPLSATVVVTRGEGPKVSELIHKRFVEIS